MNPTVLYTLPLVPGGVLLGAMIFLLFVPALALAALIAVALLALGIAVSLAGAVVAMPVLLARTVRRRRLTTPRQRPRLATQAGVMADANPGHLGEPRPMQLPLHTKGIQ